MEVVEVVEVVEVLEVKSLRQKLYRQPVGAVDVRCNKYLVEVVEVESLTQKLYSLMEEEELVQVTSHSQK